MQEEYLKIQLKKLHNITASTSLQKKMYATVSHLPAKHSNFYFPLFAFRSSLVGIPLVFFVLIGYGIVVANTLSIPGKPLYPIRQTMETVMPKIVPIEKITPVTIPQITSEPSITPPKTITPSVTPENRQGKKPTSTQEPDDKEKDGQRPDIPHIQNIHVPEESNDMVKDLHEDDR